MTDRLEEIMDRYVNKMVWIKELGWKYGYIGYDFMNTRQLTNEAVEQVRDLFWEMAWVDGRKQKSVPPMPGSGISQKVQLEVCREYLPRLKEIVLDRENWM
mgnify:FL=1